MPAPMFVQAVFNFTTRSSTSAEGTFYTFTFETWLCSCYITPLWDKLPARTTSRRYHQDVSLPGGEEEVSSEVGLGDVKVAPDFVSCLQLDRNSCVVGRVENHFGKVTLSSPELDSNLKFHVIGSLAYCENSAIDHAATEAGR
uniref:Uncharacterized protein n=1 Tax=Timema bartmani TaxID=61472 RepID=A0A7R9HZY6_9NEOP|nr:unnamed protein product [Timema bartmani]